MEIDEFEGHSSSALLSSLYNGDLYVGNGSGYVLHINKSIDFKLHISDLKQRDSLKYFFFVVKFAPIYLVWCIQSISIFSFFSLYHLFN